MNLNKSQPSPAEENPVDDAATSSTSKLLLVGGGVVALAGAGALAFVLLSGGEDIPEGTAALPKPSASATPSPSETAGTPSTSASIPTYAAKNARDPFKALVKESTGGSSGGTGGGGGGSTTVPTTAPGSGGGGGGFITLPGRTVTVTQTVSPSSNPTTAPTGLPTSTATQTPLPTGTAPVVEVPHGTQMVSIADIEKDTDGKPVSVTVVVDNKRYEDLTPQRDIDPAKWQTFGTYYTLLNLTDTTATIRYGDGRVFDVTLGFYYVVQS